MVGSTPRVNPSTHDVNRHTHCDDYGHRGEFVQRTHCEDDKAYSVDPIAETHTLTTSPNNDEDVEELRNVDMRRIKTKRDIWDRRSPASPIDPKRLTRLVSEA